jgi:alpha-1,6-mannosyltransferase
MKWAAGRMLNRPGSGSLAAGLVMAVSFVTLLPLPTLIGPDVWRTVSAFLVASAAYGVAVHLTVRQPGQNLLSWKVLWGIAILLRVILLARPPTLSDDVYRYIWDGHLVNQGINPYTLPVNSPLLDAYTIPLRELVNHNWMASPYLPAAQFYFALVTRFAPASAFAFQLAAVILDLGTGWLVVKMLQRLSIPGQAALIYLWNPLVILEFAHGAHLEALMIFLMIAALNEIITSRADSYRPGIRSAGSVILLAAATLTKGLPGLLVPLVLRKWGWTRLVLYGAIVTGACALFAFGAGWGLIGPLDGKGLFGALRIYLQQWDYNGGLFHWLQVWLTGYQPTDSAQIQDAGATTRTILRLAAGSLLGIATSGAAFVSWRLKLAMKPAEGDRNLLRLALIPLGAFLLLTNTLHPWYVTPIISLLPFLLPARGEATASSRFIWPWLYFSAAVGLSYLSYLHPPQVSESFIVQGIEYLPLYLLLIWAAAPYWERRPGRINRK